MAALAPNQSFTFIKERGRKLKDHRPESKKKIFIKPRRKLLP